MKDKTFAVLMIAGLVVLGATAMIMAHQHEDISLNGVTLSQQDYQAIKEVFGDEYASVRVCNIKSGKCIGFFDIDEIKN